MHITFFIMIITASNFLFHTLNLVNKYSYIFLVPEILLIVLIPLSSRSYRSLLFSPWTNV